MKAVSTSETSVNFYETAWRNITGYSHIHMHRWQILKSHFLKTGSLQVQETVVWNEIEMP
jgi:hypothetical protein